MFTGLRAIGYLNSCFKEKNGTPRQAAVCQHSKARLVIDCGFTNPHHSLIGLEEYSHLWLIFLFHKNDNSHNRAKVQPPRLDGEKIGVFASRSPHRPNPIGLTLSKLDKIDGNTIYLSGVDLIDGTPILDIKPFISEYDSPASEEFVKQSPWLQEPPVTVLEVEFSEHATDTLNLFYCDQRSEREKKYQLHLFDNVDEARSVIKDVITADPRSVYRRSKCKDQMYHFTIDTLNVSCKFEGNVAVITQIQPMDDISLVRNKLQNQF